MKATLLQILKSLILKATNNSEEGPSGNWVNYYKDVSPVDIVDQGRIEPLGVIGTDLINAPELSDIHQATLNIVVSYYMQASLIVGGQFSMRVRRTLNALNPNKDFDTLIGTLEGDSANVIMDDDYGYGLPIEAKYLPTNESMPDLNKRDSLAIGKVFELKLDEKMAPIPVVVRLSSKKVKPSVITMLLTGERTSDTIAEQYYNMKSVGFLNGLRDMVFSSEVIRRKKKAITEDDSGIYLEMLSRINRGKLFSFLSKRPSLGDISSVYIISKENAKEIEKIHKGSFDAYRTRKRIFRSAMAMVMVVVDREDEMCTFYYRNNKHGTTVSYKDITAQAKSSGPDVTDVLKALTLGNRVNF